MVRGPALRAIPSKNPAKPKSRPPRPSPTGACQSDLLTSSLPRTPGNHHHCKRIRGQTHMGSQSEHRAGGLDSAPIVHRLDKRDCISGVIVDRNCAAQTTRRIESENYGNIATGSHHELRSTSGILLKVSTRGDSRDRSVLVPELVNVRDKGWLVVFKSCVPNVSTVGDTVTIGDEPTLSPPSGPPPQPEKRHSAPNSRGKYFFIVLQL
jgi:hypothetical protein